MEKGTPKFCRKILLKVQTTIHPRPMVTGGQRQGLVLLGSRLVAVPGSGECNAGSRESMEVTPESVPTRVHQPWVAGLPQTRPPFPFCPPGQTLSHFSLLSVLRDACASFLSWPCLGGATGVPPVGTGSIVCLQLSFSGVRAQPGAGGPWQVWAV